MPVVGLVLLVKHVCNEGRTFFGAKQSGTRENVGQVAEGVQDPVVYNPFLDKSQLVLCRHFSLL